MSVEIIPDEPVNVGGNNPGRGWTELINEKKLKYFAEAIANEVESKKRKARREMAAQMEEAISRAVAEAQAKAEAQIAASEQEILKANNKRIAEARTEARRELAALREKLTAALLSDINTDLAALTHEPAYESFLIDSVQATQAQSRHNFTYIQLPPSNMHLAATVQEATNLIPEADEDIDIGNYRLLSANRNIAVEPIPISSNFLQAIPGLDDNDES